MERVGDLTMKIREPVRFQSGSSCRHDDLRNLTQFAAQTLLVGAAFRTLKERVAVWRRRKNRRQSHCWHHNSR